MAVNIGRKRRKAGKNPYELSPSEQLEVARLANQSESLLNAQVAAIQGGQVYSGSITGTANSETPVCRVTTGTLNAAAGGGQNVTIVGPAGLDASYVVHACINTYSGDGEPVITNVTPTGGGNITLRVFNLHATLALNATATVDIFFIGTVV